MKPLFMWAGGKTKLIKKYENIIPVTGFDTYVEPFCGGGSVFLWMKQHNPNAKFIINDINDELMNLYKCIRDIPRLFTNCVDIWQNAFLTVGDKEDRKTLYYTAREMYWKLDEQRLFSVEGASLLYFLMKTSFNGIWQTCQESHGRFGTPAGLLNQKDKIYDKDLVFEWSEILKGVEIKSGDFNSLDIPANSVVFCDPPYRNSFTNYGTGFDDNSQKRLVTACKLWKDKGSKIYLANRDSDDKFFETLLPDSKFHRFPITYTAGRRKKTKTGFEAKPATELLIEI